MIAAKITTEKRKLYKEYEKKQAEADTALKAVEYLYDLMKSLETQIEDIKSQPNEGDEPNDIKSQIPFKPSLPKFSTEVFPGTNASREAPPNLTDPLDQDIFDQPVVTPGSNLLMPGQEIGDPAIPLKTLAPAPPDYEQTKPIAEIADPYDPPTMPPDAEFPGPVEPIDIQPLPEIGSPPNYGEPEDIAEQRFVTDLYESTPKPVEYYPLPANPTFRDAYYHMRWKRAKPKPK